MNERAIFEAALEIQHAQRRREYLDQVCAGSPALRTRVETLLKSHDAAGSFLDLPVVDQLPPGSAPPPDRTTDFSPAADTQDDDDQIDLSFLHPATSPGSIGTLAHYKILQMLGRGGFGIVLKAFDEKLHRLVAIKAMNPQLATTSPPRKRFLREARAAAAIKHENIVHVYSVEEQPLPYLVMEYVDGQTLQQRLDGTGPLDVPEVLNLGRQIAIGLAAAHAMGLIHRDIKPGNILLEQGAEPKVKITDFGLARAADDASMTRTGVVSGTPMYMAPEQALGQPLDHRADLFSFGSVLYQMACGRPPFRAATTVAVLRRVADDAPRPLQEILPEIPAWLAAIVAKLHAKNPDERFQSAKEVADLLARCQAELHQQGRVESLPEILKITAQQQAALPAVGHDADAAERADQVPPSKPIDRQADRRSQRWVAALIATFVLCGGLVLTEATGVTKIRGTVMRWYSPDRTLVVSQELVTDTKNGREVEPVDQEAAPVVAVGNSPKAGAPLAPRYKNSLGMEFALVPQGKAWLGGGGGKVGDREVEFKDDFYLGVYEVTQDEWEQVMGNNPSVFAIDPAAKAPSQELLAKMDLVELKKFTDELGRRKKENYWKTVPVEQVSWEDSQVFVKRLNQKEKTAGWIYRLPTESEWEYACRGGGGRPVLEYGFDYYLETPTNTLLPEQANFNNVLMRTYKVGGYQPNRLGLHDMHGNVWEWCQDELQDAEGTSQRVARGGGWNFGAEFGRAAFRRTAASSRQDYNLGLRLARVSRESAPVMVTGDPSPPTVDPTQDGQFVPLFNGKDFEGWAMRNPKTIKWTISDLAVRGANSGYHPSNGGAIFTTRSDYGDFHFRCELLAGQRGETWIYFRHNTTLEHGARRGYAVPNPNAEKLAAPDAWGIGSIYEDVFQVGHQRVAAAAVPGPKIQPGDWYKLEIIARGDMIRVIVNGTTTTEFQAVDPPDRWGSFGFGCPILSSLAVRNVEVMEFKPGKEISSKAIEGDGERVESR